MKYSSLAKICITLAAAMVLSAPLFSGEAAAAGNPLIGEWKVRYIDSSGGSHQVSEGFASQGIEMVMKFTDTTMQLGLKQKGDSGMTPPEDCTYRMVSEGVWNICDSAESSCMTATFKKGSTSSLILHPDNGEGPDMELTRRR
jgi:hypothetical protein